MTVYAIKRIVARTFSSWKARRTRLSRSVIPGAQSGANNFKTMLAEAVWMASLNVIRWPGGRIKSSRQEILWPNPGVTTLIEQTNYLKTKKFSPALLIT